MSPALLLLLTFAATCRAQADGKFWWRRPPSSSAAAQQDSVMPGTMPPPSLVEGGAGESVAVPSRVQPPGAAPAPEPTEDEDSRCVCVDYYLCGPDGYIITTGEGLVDVRVGPVVAGAQCSGIQVCCKPPKKVRPSPSTPPTTTTTTVADLYPEDECGIRGGDMIDNVVDVRIINGGGDRGGGGATEFGEFPWTLVVLKSPASSPDASAQSEQPRDNTFVCGASLVHRQVAMTAAHCVARRDIMELKVRAGEWDTQQMSEPLPHQERRVSRVLVHPGFYEGTLYNDVALLFLDTPFQLARNVRTLCLPGQGDVFDGRRCIATGWGKNAFGRNGTYQMTMKMVDLPVVGHDACQEKLRGTRLSQYFNLHESFVCAGGEEGKDTCKGDGGGPLFCRSPLDSGRYVQLGITSWGIGCGDTDVPAVYANVPSFADWITTQVFDAFGSLNTMRAH